MATFDIHFPDWPSEPPAKTAPLGQNAYKWERYCDGNVHLLWDSVHWHGVPLASVRRAFHRWAERVGYAGRSAAYTFVNRKDDSLRHCLAIQVRPAGSIRFVNVDEDTAELITDTFDAVKAAAFAAHRRV